MAFGPLDGPEADAVRADLIAARDAPSRHEVPRSDIALGLTVLRSKGTPRTNEPVLRSIATGADNEELHGVTLAGTFVSWSSEPGAEPQQKQQPVRASFTLHGPIPGVVRDVDST